MVQPTSRFGQELRRRRLGAGISLTAFAQRVHYSKAQLSKLERGLMAPSSTFAQMCDVELDANGELTALVAPDPRSKSPSDDGEVWLMGLSTDGGGWFRSVNRREVMTVGALSAVGLGISAPRLSPGANESTLINTFRTFFEQYRSLGQTVGPTALIPALIAHTHTLQSLAEQARPGAREELLRLGSRYAEYVGWLSQEAGNDRAALWWTKRAVDLASSGGDPHLAAYGLVRNALVTLYRGEAAQTVQLARRAQHTGVPHRIRGLAAQREAQGHALAGDQDACMRQLDHARTLLSQASKDSDVPVIGTTNLPDPAAMVRGWCLYDLGLAARAAEVIDTELARVPPHATRTRARYGIRSALAHTTAGEIEHACALTRALLPALATVDSATVDVDVRALTRRLAAHRRHPAVRDLLPDLTTP